MMKSTLTNKRKNKMLPSFLLKRQVLSSDHLPSKKSALVSLYSHCPLLKKSSNLQRNKPTHPSIPYIIQNFNATTNLSILPKSQHLFVVFLITYNENKFGKYINIK